MIFSAGRGAIPILRIGVCFVTAPPTAVLFFVFPHAPWWVLPPAVAAPVLLYYVPRLAASLYGDMDPQRVYVRYGLIIRREMVVPLHALRTFECWTPPLHRLFRCRTVVLRFAGGCVWLPLLDAKTAERLTVRLEDA